LSETGCAQPDCVSPRESRQRETKARARPDLLKKHSLQTDPSLKGQESWQVKAEPRSRRYRSDFAPDCAAACAFTATLRCSCVVSRALWVVARHRPHSASHSLTLIIQTLQAWPTRRQQDLLAEFGSMVLCICIIVNPLTIKVTGKVRARRAIRNYLTTSIKSFARGNTSKERARLISEYRYCRGHDTSYWWCFRSPTKP